MKKKHPEIQKLGEVSFIALYTTVSKSIIIIRIFIL